MDWPATAEDLATAQQAIAELAADARRSNLWVPGDDPLVGGCFVAFARGEAGPGHPGDRAWAAAVTWRPSTVRRRRDGAPFRSPGRALKGVVAGDTPRRAHDVEGQAVVAGRVGAAYAPGLLALREGPILAAAVAALDPRPDVLLVDATGLDHPRGCGLAVHLGAIARVPTVGVTQRPLVAAGGRPPMTLRRGCWSDAVLAGAPVARWLCTRTGAVPILTHPGWRTDLNLAAQVVLAASTEAGRTPVPLHEARRVAREARAIAAGE
jgi:deoxyribonuclease V